MKLIKCKYCTIYIQKEQGRLYVKNKDSISQPIKFGAYASDNEPLTLYDYRNIRNITLKKAVEELDGINAVLVTNRFDINFYNEEDVDKFTNLITQD